MFPSTDKNDGTLGGSHSVMTKNYNLYQTKLSEVLGEKYVAMLILRQFMVIFTKVEHKIVLK